MSSIRRVLPVLALLVAAVAQPLVGRDLEGCDDFMRYVERENFPRALEELNWCNRSVEDLHFAKITEIMDRSIAGYDPEEITVEGALGFATIMGVYDNGSSQIEFSVTTGSAAGSAASAGLSALSGLASSFGVRSRGSDQVRIGGLTDQIQEQGRGVNLRLSMEGGIILNIEGESAEAVEEFAEDIIADLEDYLG